MCFVSKTQHTHFRANSKAKKVSVDLTDVTDEEDVLGGKHFIWKDVPLTVPHCPASSLQYCTLIDIRYELIVSQMMRDSFSHACTVRNGPCYGGGVGPVRTLLNSLSRQTMYILF